MVKDRGIKNLKDVLSDYIKEIGYIQDTEPFGTNMTLNEQGGFVNLPEYQIFATAKNPEGISVSFTLIPSKKSIFIEDELVKTLD